MKSHEIPSQTSNSFQDGEAIDLAFNKKRADDRKALDDFLAGMLISGGFDGWFGGTLW